MVQILREDHPRLYHPVDDPDYRFDPPGDEARKQILRSCFKTHFAPSQRCAIALSF